MPLARHVSERPVARATQAILGAGTFVLALLLGSATQARAALPDHPALARGPVPSWVEVVDLEADLDAAPSGVDRSDDDATSAGEADTEDAIAESEGEEQTGDDQVEDAEGGTDDEGDTDDEDDSGGARWLLVEAQLRLRDRGPVETYERHTYRIDRRSALDEWSSWQVAFDPRDERIVLHHLRIRRNGAWLDRLTDSQASVLQREAELERQIFDETETLHIVLDDVRVGDVVDIAWSTTGANPIFGDRFSGSYPMRWNVPVDRRRLRLVHPLGRPVHLLPVAGTPEPEIEERGGLREVSWDLCNVEAHVYVPSLPNGVWVVPFVQLGEHTDWAEVARWGAELFRTRPSRAVDEVAAELDAVLGPSPSEAEVIAAALRFVQDELRYFAFVMGPHSHQPHDPDDILRRRYGDCKDKSFLLIHLLEHYGIDAWPVLVDTTDGPGLADLLPSPYLFDHAIVGLRRGSSSDSVPDSDSVDERIVYVDPTRSLQGGVEAIHVPDYGWGLELRPGVTGLSRIAPDPAAMGRTEITYDYDVGLGIGDSFDATITSTYFGGDADEQRAMLDGTTPSELLEGYLGFYEADEHEIESLGDLEITDDRDANRIVIVERYRITSIADDSTQATYFSSLPTFIAGMLDDPPDEEDRGHPFSLPHPSHYVETLSVTTPDAIEWDTTDAKLDTGWLRYRVDTDVDANVYTARYEFETLADRVPIEDRAAYVHVQEVIAENVGAYLFDYVADTATRRLALGGLLAVVSFLGCLFFASTVFLRRRGLL